MGCAAGRTFDACTARGTWPVILGAYWAHTLTCHGGRVDAWNAAVRVLKRTALCWQHRLHALPGCEARILCNFQRQRICCILLIVCVVRMWDIAKIVQSCERALPATVLQVLSTEAGCVTCQDFIHQAINLIALIASQRSHAGVDCSSMPEKVVFGQCCTGDIRKLSYTTSTSRAVACASVTSH